MLPQLCNLHCQLFFFIVRIFTVGLSVHSLPSSNKLFVFFLDNFEPTQDSDDKLVLSMIRLLNVLNIGYSSIFFCCIFESFFVTLLVTLNMRNLLM